MNNLTPQQREALLSRLVDCQCHSGIKNRSECEPIMIGDVLEKIEHLRQSEPFANTSMRWVNKVISPWSRCGFTKSLQEINEDVMENCYGCEQEKCICVMDDGIPKYELKPEAMALMVFINKIV